MALSVPSKRKLVMILSRGFAESGIYLRDIEKLWDPAQAMERHTFGVDFGCSYPLKIILTLRTEMSKKDLSSLSNETKRLFNLELSGDAWNTFKQYASPTSFDPQKNLSNQDLIST